MASSSATWRPNWGRRASRSSLVLADAITRWSIYGARRAQPGGNRSQMGEPRKRLKQADPQPVATHGNAFGAHGNQAVCQPSPPVAEDLHSVKEGVDLESYATAFAPATTSKAWSLCGAPWSQPGANLSLPDSSYDPPKHCKPLPALATNCRQERMVRRGSTVRVRQRASMKCLQIGISRRLFMQHAGTPRVHLW